MKKTWYYRTVHITENFLIYMQVHLDRKQFNVVVLPCISFFKCSEEYNLQFQWLTFDVQLCYNRGNHEE